MFAEGVYPNAVTMLGFFKPKVHLVGPEPTDSQRAELATHVVRGWQALARCGSTNDRLWFPDADNVASKIAAVSRCAGCPVRRSCLAHALRDSETGVWGGTTDVQRAALRLALADGVPVTDVLGSPTGRPAGTVRRTA